MTNFIETAIWFDTFEDKMWNLEQEVQWREQLEKELLELNERIKDAK